MRGIAILLLSIAAIASTTELASARDGCGSGRYYNGYRCVPMGYNQPRYDPRTQYGYQPYRQNYNFGCPPRYSIQDGVCKPYRGY